MIDSTSIGLLERIKRRLDWNSPTDLVNQWGIQVTSVSLLLLLWNFGLSAIDSFLFPTPIEIVESMFQNLFVNPVLFWAIIEALTFAAIGYAAASLLGVSVGLLVGLWQPAKNTLNPILDAMYITPIIALIPLVILIFGLSFTAKVFIVFLMAFFIITFNTITGIEETPDELVSASRVFGADGFQVFREVHLKWALPNILAGLRLGSGRAVRGMVVAELFIFAGDLGTFLVGAGQTFDMPRLYATIITLSLTGLIVIKLARAIELQLLSYRAINS
jgi:NitT/TauT family transport system permease protein